MNVVQLLEERLQATPAQTALIHGNERITFRDLEQRSRAVGAYFQAAGIQPGQRALLLVPLGIDFYVMLLGLLRIGVAVVLVDQTMGKEQAVAAVASVAPDLFIGSPKAHLLRLTTGVVRRIVRKFTWGGWVPGSSSVRVGHASRCRDAQCPEDAPALITFTSGSTGQPKAICRTHGFLHRQHKVLCQTLALAPGTVEMNTLPVFILSSLAQGATVVMPSQIGQSAAQVDYSKIVTELAQHAVTRLLAAPAFCDGIAKALTTEARSLPRLHQIYTGGGPVFMSLLTKLQTLLPSANIVAVYGSTEAEPIAHIDLATLGDEERQAMCQRRGLLAGKPIAEIEVAILPDRAGHPQCYASTDALHAARCPAYQTGEIVVAGAHVQQGYLAGDDGITKFCVNDTVWHRTGDAGYLDAQGRLWLMGRCSAKVQDGMQTLYPFGLEAAAMAHVGVERAAFVRVNDENVVAIEATEKVWSQIADTLQSELHAMGAQRVCRVATIPVDARHQSKVRYSALAEQLA